MAGKLTLPKFADRRWMPAVVWTLRVVLGCLFMMSGFVKADDLWGFVFKIEEYLAVWGMWQPRSVVFIFALAVSGAEFVFGFLLATGCYKRVAVWALTAMMAVMLPLTAYLVVANPVDDCGCFGDFWVISNTWSFIKNLLITAGLVFLLIYNPDLKSGVYKPAIQWIIGAWVSLYIIIVGLYGYNVQPMVDFRPYPVGSAIYTAEGEETDDSPAENTDDEDADAEDDLADNITFIYEKEGRQQEFTLDNLPDSTWTFVERRGEAAVESGAGEGAALTVYDESGDDVTEEVLGQGGRQLLLVIPEPRRVDISYTYFLNELKQWADTSGVDMECLIAADRRGIDYWKDVSMATYGVYTAEDTKLKELVRGTMSLVEVDSGIIRSKYTLSSIPGFVIDQRPQGTDLLEVMAPRPAWLLRWLTGLTGAVLLAVYLFQSLILALVDKVIRKKA